MSYVNPDHLSFFTFIGRIVAKAMYDDCKLEAYFTRSFYKHMLGKKVDSSDMEALDPDFYKNLQWMLDNSIEGVLDLTFSADTDEFGRVKVVDLKPGGRDIEVTDDNKLEYVSLMCEHQMSHGIKQQLAAFLQGFHELIAPELVAPFDANELELLISGLPTIDLADLVKNTEYQGYTESQPVIQWFWKALYEFSDELKAWFLQFVTGTSQVPLEGFKGLIGMRGPQKFSIHRAYGEDRLPTAHTCFNQLDLPDYSTEEILRKKLLQAICEGHEGFGFV
jgi:E3 ubiquitin-protein ligase HUWE1